MTDRRIIVVLAVSLGALFSRADEPVFTISGRVIDGVSEKAVGRVRVVLSNSVDPIANEVASLTTGPDGKFRFRVPEGKFRMVVERLGLPPQNFGTVQESGFGVAIVTGPSQVTDDLTFRLEPPAAISGKIIDEAGEAVEGALVQLIKTLVLGGRKMAVMRAWAYSNDIGEYRFGSLGPGTFYIAVTGAPWYANSSRNDKGNTPDAGAAISYAPVFYPNVRDPRAAVPIALRPGQEFGADFTLALTPGFNLTVQPTEGPTDRQPLHLQVVGEGPQGSKLFEKVTSVEWPKTILSSIPPGRYRLNLVKDGEWHALASTSLEISSADVEVAMPAATASSVSGTVRFEGGELRGMKPLFVALHDEKENLGVSRPVKPNGAFSIPSVPPGIYRVHVAGDLGVSATGLVLAGGKINNTVLEVGADGTAGLTILAVKGGGRVRGFIRRDRRPVPGILAVLLPVNPTDDHVQYRGFMTDRDGSFDWRGLLQGEYFLFATEDTEFEYANPEVVRTHLAGSQQIRVGTNQTVEVDIDLK